MSADKVKIVVADGYTLNPGDNPWDEVGKLGELTVYDRTPPDQILERCREADIILTNKVPLSRDTLSQLPRLKYISVLATGYNIVDAEAARERDIPVSNVPVYGTNSVAQYVFAMLLELCHHVGLHGQAVKNGEWVRRQDFSFWDTPLVELYGKVMVIVGFGRIGRRVGELAHAFGMEVLAVDIVQRDPPEYSPFSWAATVEQAFRQADVVSLNCALTEDNEKMVNKQLLAVMKQRAFLINAARGQLIDEPALIDALNSGGIAGAALDVVSKEPLAADSPLLKAKNCILTPHIAWAALESRQRLMKTTVENVKGFLSGNVQNRVN